MNSSFAKINRRPTAIPTVPVWDKHRRELRLGGVVLKQFRLLAKNQELIVEAFEEGVNDTVGNHAAWW